MEVRSLTRSLSSLDLHLQSLVTGAVRVVVDVVVVLDPCLPRSENAKTHIDKEEVGRFFHVFSARFCCLDNLDTSLGSQLLRGWYHSWSTATQELAVRYFFHGKVDPVPWNIREYQRYAWCQDVSICVNWCPAFHCIPLHSIAFHCIPLHSIAFHCIPLHSIAFHCIPLHSIAFHCIPLHSGISHYGRIWARNKDVAFKKSMAGLKPSNRGTPWGWIEFNRTNASCLVFLVRHRPSIPGPASKSMSVSKGEARSNRSNWCNFQPILVARLGSSLLHWWCGVKHRTHDMPYIALHRGHCRARWSPMTS